MRSSILVLLFLALSTLGLTPDPAPQPTDENGWVNLFNGENLDNWIQRNGEAPYEIEGDMIVGTTIMNTPNSFLCTKENYGDFILEYDVIVDPLVNSGVQIRSNSMESYRNGRVHGYQVELDPSSRAWTAGIYDEARRGWLYSLSRNKAAQDAFKQGTWNTIRVEAVGSSIRTWINGVMASNLVDDMTAEGFIALQVHSIGSEEMKGKKDYVAQYPCQNNGP